MALGMEVGLGPCHTVLDRDLSPPKGHSHPPNFRPMSVAVKLLDGSRFKMPLDREVDVGPGDIVLHEDPAPFPQGTAPNFRPMSVVAKWPDG